MAQKILVKTDKNGTKYYNSTVPCDRCEGRGDYWWGAIINGRPQFAGTCYKCGGSGTMVVTEKEYTPEHAKKLEEQRAKRAEKRQAERDAEAVKAKEEWLEKNGFDGDHNTFLFLGNTYEQKDAIKAAGGKYNNVIGWHIVNPVEGFQFLQVSLEEVARETYWGWDFTFELFDKNNIKARCKEEYNRLNNIQEHESEWVGKVGDKIQMELTYTRSFSWDASPYGYYGSSVTFCHMFKDNQGNVIVWKTGLCLEADYGEKVLVKGTIKQHDEYKGTKQTVLTRCKVTEVSKD